MMYMYYIVGVKTKTMFTFTMSSKLFDDFICTIVYSLMS